MSDIKLCQNMPIENMWGIFHVGRKCLKICRQICQAYYVVTTLNRAIKNDNRAFHKFQLNTSGGLIVLRNL